MATLTKEQKKQDLEHALAILEVLREGVENGGGVLLISADFGKGLTDYFKVSFASVGDLGRVTISHLTWAIAKVCGYSLRDRNGSWFLAVNGYGFSKFDDIADSLARFYGVASIRWERA